MTPPPTSRPLASARRPAPACSAGPQRPRLALLLTVLAAGLGTLTHTAIAARPGEAYPRFADDGAWCWFSDPRALACGGATVAGWVASDGSIVVGAQPAGTTAAAATTVLHPQFERDDHDHPALVSLPDGRLAAFYSLHARGDLRLRVTLRPGDIGAWSEERILPFNGDRGRRGTTYANPVVLRDERDALYVFWRAADFKPTFAVSPDAGLTWSVPHTLIARPGADDTNRPYLKLSSDGAGRIDFVFTDGHPRDEATNSVYYVRYERGAFFKADGTRLGGLADLPLDPARCDRIYDGASAGRAWVWDIATTSTGQPVVAFTRHPAETDHRYAVARWTPVAGWQTEELVAAGGWFPHTPAGRTEREPHYSGGMSLDHADPATLYTSRRIDGVFEIERWRRTDHSGWRAEAITAHSRQDNVRPFAVRHADPRGPSVLWMNLEDYAHYTDFRGTLRAAGPAEASVVR